MVCVQLDGGRVVRVGGAAQEQRILAGRENEQLGDLVAKPLGCERAGYEHESDCTPHQAPHKPSEMVTAAARPRRDAVSVATSSDLPLTHGFGALASRLEMSRPERTTILDARALSRALQRMAVEVLELSHGTDDLVLIGIQRRGVELAERISRLIEKDEGVAVPRGALDTTLYRDGLEVVETRIPGDLAGKHVVIVDDVLYTG